MKIKGINIFERHLEKLILAVCLVALLAMFSLQFLGSGNAIKVGGEEVSPERAGQLVRLKAEEKISQINATSVVAGIPTEMKSITQQYEEALARARASYKTQAFAFGTPDVLRDASGPSDFEAPVVGSGSKKYPEFAPPTPTQTFAMLYEGTLDPSIVMSTPGLEEFVPAQQPYDIRSISVQSTIDVESLRDAVFIPEAGSAPMPRAWWDRRVEIIDVEIERQQRRADASWSEPRPVAKVPAQHSLREQIEIDFPVSRLRGLLAEERTNRESIRRPKFYDVIHGEPWIYPARAHELLAERSSMNSEDAEVDSLVRQLERMRREMARYEQQKANLLDSDAKREDRTSRRNTGAFEGVYAQEGGGGGAPRGGRQSGGKSSREEMERAEKQRREQRLARLDEKITQLNGQISTTEDALRELGFNPQGHAFRVTDDTQLDEPLDAISDSLVDSVTLWAHDLATEPGTSYRYRMRYAITNPYFGQSVGLEEGQKELASEVVLWSEPGEWSEAITVSPDVQFFVTDAKRAGRGIGGESSADVEVYRFFYGYWRKGEAQLEPGDEVVAALELPELPIFSFGRDETTGEFAITATETLSDPVFASGGAFLLETAPSLASAGNAMAFLGTREGGMLRRDPTQDLANRQREQMEFSARTGQGAVVGDPLEEPGSDSAAPGSRVPGGDRERGPSSGTGRPSRGG